MNMKFICKLPIPQDVKAMYPLSEKAAAIKAANDEEIIKVFTGESDKLVLGYRTLLRRQRGRRA